ncbi:hypothetical protein HAX54_039868 [Datura stramonium]|uniref:Protein-serine/threonine phosphatase n=1 Tax=Datura stramonium TaxID=4076 RepID=A0ABS8VLX5_DATST|nr:hypothetical protein [Datura stramonium]
MAVIQANNLMEDQSQLESGPLNSVKLGPHGTFVGLYDGHGGPETSRFINDVLFSNLKSTICMDCVLKHMAQKGLIQALGSKLLGSVEPILYIVHLPQLVSCKSTSMSFDVSSNLKVSRSIGDAYLKKSEFNQAPLLARFRLPEPFSKLILSASHQYPFTNSVPRINSSYLLSGWFMGPS